MRVTGLRALPNKPKTTHWLAVCTFKWASQQLLKDCSSREISIQEGFSLVSSPFKCLSFLVVSPKDLIRCSHGLNQPVMGLQHFLCWFTTIRINQYSEKKAWLCASAVCANAGSMLYWSCIRCCCMNLTNVLEASEMWDIIQLDSEVFPLKYISLSILWLVEVKNCRN